MGQLNEQKSNTDEDLKVSTSAPLEMIIKQRMISSASRKKSFGLRIFWNCGHLLSLSAIFRTPNDIHNSAHKDPYDAMIP